jgi:integral membrane sensor domain MASE1
VRFMRTATSVVFTALLFFAATATAQEMPG